MSEFLYSPSAIGFFDILDDSEQEQIIDHQVEHSLSKLTSNQRRVIELRYGLGCEPHTLHQAATILDVSTTAIHKAEKAAIKKLTD